MKPKTIKICTTHIDIGCRRVCPLAKACQTNHHENHAMLANRMNAVADRVKVHGWP